MYVTGITRDFLMGIATACPNLSHMVLERCGSLKPTDPRGALEAERRLGYSPGIFSSDSRNDGSRPSLSESTFWEIAGYASHMSIP